MRRIVPLLLALVMCLSLCACGATVADDSVSSAQEAISKIVTDSLFDKQVALRCGFHTYQDAVIGNRSAELNSSNDAYIVTITGHMYGTVDDYANDFVCYNFTIVKEVMCSDGTVNNVRFDIQKD